MLFFSDSIIQFNVQLTIWKWSSDSFRWSREIKEAIDFETFVSLQDGDEEV